MASSSAYKGYQRKNRILTVEQNSAMGMQYSDAPLAESYSKVLANMDFKD